MARHDDPKCIFVKIPHIIKVMDSHVQVSIAKKLKQLNLHAKLALFSYYKNQIFPFIQEKEDHHQTMVLNSVYLSEVCTSLNSCYNHTLFALLHSCFKSMRPNAAVKIQIWRQ